VRPGDLYIDRATPVRRHGHPQILPRRQVFDWLVDPLDRHRVMPHMLPQTSPSGVLWRLFGFQRVLVAISNHRLVALQDGEVMFRWARLGA
jgi:hypothetical protein